MLNSKEKELYTKAQVLLSIDNPSNTISAMMLLHELVYSIKSDGSDEQRFWKGHAAVALADLYINGVKECDYVADDGTVYAKISVNADLLKAYELYRRAIRYECYDGVVCIADIYYLLNDTSNAVKWYCAAIEYGFKGAENAREIIDEMVSSGKVSEAEIPNHVPMPQYSPSFEFCPIASNL